MKLLLLCCLVVLGWAHPTLLEKDIESNNVAQVSPFLKDPLYAEDTDKKLGKRSFGWSPWGLGLGHSIGWPWLGGHGWGHGGWSGLGGGHGWLGGGHGWSHGWPILYSYGGHGHGGWHSKW